MSVDRRRGQTDRKGTSTRQPAIAWRIAFIIIACTLALTVVWIWLRPPQWQAEDQAYRLEAHYPELPSIVNSDANLKATAVAGIGESAPEDD